MSRAKVGDATGLSQAALSTLLGLLIESGIVHSNNRTGVSNRRGRPQTTVSLNEQAGIAITVSLAVDSITVCTVNYSGDTVAQQHYSMNSRSLTTKQLYDLFFTYIKNAIKEQTGQQLQTISVGFQGVTDSIAGELLWSPILSIEKTPIAEKLRKKFNVPVSVNNDCGLIAAALHNQQNKTLGESFVTVLFSHGIGMGLYMAGKPVCGATTSALELGHVQFIENGAPCRCGKHGCIEAYAADYGIAGSAQKNKQLEESVGSISHDQFLTLINAANNGNQSAIEAFKLAGKAIGSGLATVFTLLDPMPVALVGRTADAINLMTDDIRTGLNLVGRSPQDWSSLLHCYNDDTALLLEGLVLDAMAQADHTFAMRSDVASKEASHV